MMGGECDGVAIIISMLVDFGCSFAFVLTEANREKFCLRFRLPCFGIRASSFWLPLRLTVFCCRPVLREQD
jgi:hypothetical protein